MAPPPSTVPAVTGPSYRSRTAATAPGRSVLSASTTSPSSSSSVFAAPASAARGVTSRASASAVRFSGMVSDRPRQDASHPARKSTSPSSATRSGS